MNHRLIVTIATLLNLVPHHHNAPVSTAVYPVWLQPAKMATQTSVQTPKTFAKLQTVYVPPPAPTTFPVAPTGTYANTYAWGNCTWYVAGRKQVPDTWHNASTWAYYARLAGYTVSDVPLVGSIAQKTGGEGHVAIVEAVSGGQVEVSEMNVLGLDVVDDAWYPISYFQNYIYV